MAENVELIEEQIHGLIDAIDYSRRSREELAGKKKRVREFFALEPEKAYEVFERIAILRGDKQNLKLHTLSKQEKEEEKVAEAVMEIGEKKRRAGKLPLSVYGLSIGSKIAFARDESIVATVAGDRQVEFEGKKYSLTSLATKLLRDNFNWTTAHSVQGPLYWTYEGRRLTDIRKDGEV